MKTLLCALRLNVICSGIKWSPVFFICSWLGALPTTAFELKILEDNSQRLVFELRHVSDKAQKNFENLKEFSAACGKCIPSPVTGEPDRPYYPVQIITQAAPTVEYRIVSSQRFTPDQRPKPVPLAIGPREEKYEADPLLYRKANSLAPIISEEKKLRSYPVRTVLLPLAGWDESKGNWSLVTHIKYTIQYPQVETHRTKLSLPNNIAGQILNPVGSKSQIKTGTRRALAKRAARPDITLEGPLVKIKVGNREVEDQEEDGLYRLTYETLRAAEALRGSGNFTYGNAVQSISMYTGPERRPLETVDSLPYGGNLRQVPIRVVDSKKDGTFDAGDYIEFFAHGTSVWNEVQWDSSAAYPIHFEYDVNPFSFHNYYFLDFKSGSGKKLQTLSAQSAAGNPKTRSYSYIRREKDWQLGNCEYRHFDGETGKDWYWVLNSKTCDGSFSGKVALTPNQLNYSGDMLVDYVKGETSYFGFYRVPITRSDNYDLEFGSENAVYVNPDAELSGSYYQMDENIDNNNFTLTWLDRSTGGYGFDGYTVIYMREHRFRDKAFYLFPDVFDQDVSWKISGSGFEVLKIEEGLPVGLLPVNSSGVFTDNAKKGLSTKYYVFSSGDFNKVEEKSIEYEKATIDGLVSGFGKVPASGIEYLIVAPDSLVHQALDLKDYRNNRKNYKTAVARTEDIYRHYSSGRVSPVAIRDYLRWLYYGGEKTTPDSSLKYVLLFGDGHFDYRNLYAEKVDIAAESIEPNFIPPFENGYNVSDDYFTYMDFGESIVHSNSRSDFALGRIPVSSDGEAAAYIEKIKTFNDPAKFGSWRNRVLATADDDFQRDAANCDIDGITHGHTNDARIINEMILASDPGKITDNVYLLNYEANFSNSKPEAAQDLLIKLNKGVIATNYIGHGSDQVWADEGLFVTKKAVPKLSNAGKTGLVTSFSCTVGRFEKFTTDGLSETLISLPDIGALATVSATRESTRGANVALAKSFYGRVFELDKTGMSKTIGDALMEAKNQGGSFINSQKYLLFGEPVETLRKAQLKVGLTKQPNSIRALDCGVMEGRVSGGSGEGYVSVDVYGANSTKLVPGLECDVSSRITYDQLLDVNGPLLFSSTVPYNNGKFKLDYVFNDRIPFGDSAAYIKVYAWDKNKPMEGNYVVDSLVVEGEANSCDMESNTGPKIIISGCERSQTSLADFDKKITLPIPYCIEVIAIDSTGGIFVTDRPDEGTTVEVWDLNGKEQLAAPVQPRLSEDEFTRKSFKWEFDNNWQPGQYLLKVRAQDGFGNISSRNLEVHLSADDFLSVYKIFNVPNPIKDKGTCFYFGGVGKQNSGNFGEEDANFDAEIKVFNQSGFLVKQLKNVSARINLGGSEEECKLRGAWWDGKDFFGNRLGNGVYYYQVKVKQDFASSSGLETKSSQRRNTLVISR